MNPEEIRVGRLYWVRLGPKNTVAKIVAAAVATDCWQCELDGGQLAYCTLAQFAGAAVGTEAVRQPDWLTHAPRKRI